MAPRSLSDDDRARAARNAAAHVAAALRAVDRSPPTPPPDGTAARDA